VAGIIPSLTVRENIVLALQASRGSWRRLSVAEQEKLADRFIQSLDIKTPSREQIVRNLSGGNQQKVLLARWLATAPKLFILDEPTRGIDVGAKAEIEKLIQSLRQEGLAVLFISSELERNRSAKPASSSFARSPKDWRIDRRRDFRGSYNAVHRDS